MLKERGTVISSVIYLFQNFVVCNRRYIHQTLRLMNRSQKTSDHWCTVLASEKWLQSVQQKKTNLVGRLWTSSCPSSKVDAAPGTRSAPTHTSGHIWILPCPGKEHWQSLCWCITAKLESASHSSHRRPKGLCIHHCYVFFRVVLLVLTSS